MSPLISVIVPIYNVEPFLCRCLDSILSQTYQNLEIILVDDGSLDRCGQICDEYARKDGRIRVIHKENAGLGYARNSGFEISTGAFIMFVDSDDFLTDDAVQVLYDRLILDGSDFATGRYTCLYPNGRKSDVFCRWMTDTVLSQAEVLNRKRFSVCAWGKLYRREVLEGIWYPPLTCAEDLWFFADLMDRCSKVSVVNHVIYYYYQRATSIVHSMTEGKRMDCLAAHIHVISWLLAKGYVSAARQRYQSAIDELYRYENRKQGIALLKASFDLPTRRRLTGFKAHLRWLSLYCPPVHYGIHFIMWLIKGKFLR